MKLIRLSDVPATPPSGGYVGTPQTPSWRKEWIEDKRRWAELECGCVIDIVHDRSLLLINSFKGTTVHCDEHGRFVGIVVQRETKRPAAKHIPDEPLF